MTLTTQVCVPQSEAIVTWNETKNGGQLDNLRGDREDTRVCLIPWFVAVLLFMLTNPEWSCIHYHRWFHVYIYIYAFLYWIYTHIFGRFIKLLSNCDVEPLSPLVISSRFADLYLQYKRVLQYKGAKINSRGGRRFKLCAVFCTNGSQIISATDGTGTERSTEPLEHPGTLILHQEILEVSSLQNYFSKKGHAQCSLACCKILAYFISTSSWVNEKSHFNRQSHFKKECLSLGVILGGGFKYLFLCSPFFGENYHFD